MKNVYYLSCEDATDSALGRIQRLSVRLADSEEEQFTNKARIVCLDFILGEPALRLAAGLRSLADELEKA